MYIDIIDIPSDELESVVGPILESNSLVRFEVKNSSDFDYEFERRVKPSDKASPFLEIEIAESKDFNHNFAALFEDGSRKILW